MILKIDKVPVPIFKFQLFLQEDVKKIMADISDKDEDYNDLNRPWVLKFIPKIQGELNEMISRNILDHSRGIPSQFQCKIGVKLNYWAENMV